MRLYRGDALLVQGWRPRATALADEARVFFFDLLLPADFLPFRLFIPSCGTRYYLIIYKSGGSPQVYSGTTPINPRGMK
jgi:hypothetical protein